MDKTAIKNYAIYARRKLIQSAMDKAALIGIYEDKTVEPVSKGLGFEIYKSNIGTEVYLSSDEIKKRNNLLIKINQDGYKQTIEEVAYTWFNRLIAVRFMEVNDYLPSRVRVLSSENEGQAESDLMHSPYSSDLEFTDKERQIIFELKEANKSDELFKFLFIKQCNDLSRYLPELFERTNDYTELLFDIRYNDKEDVVYRLVHDIPESNFNVEEEGQVEIIGWLYQFYNTEPKEKVYARPKGQKIGKSDIPAVTQLFTPDWIVKYMVENSLGRLWLDGHPNEELKANWRYYLDEAEQEETVQIELNKIREEHSRLKLEDIKLIDPCMGSGHILVYAFEVLMQMYVENGYSERDAAKSILENNLYGLDIDKRAYQLSYFALMMKARQYNRRILTLDIRPHVYDIIDSTFMSDELIDYISKGDMIAKDSLETLRDTFKDANELGSIINVPEINYDYLESKLEEVNLAGDMFELLYLDTINKELKYLVEQAKVMSSKYDVTVTNPPYTPISNCDLVLQNYVKQNYPDSKSDFFGVFIEKCRDFTEKNGYQAMITMHSWMFLSSYEKLREKLLVNNTIINMAHLGARAFEEIGGEVVQTTAFVFNKSFISRYIGGFKRLVDYNSQDSKEKAYLADGKKYIFKLDQFCAVPGKPIAYWINNSVIQSFSTYPSFGKITECAAGISSGNNEKYLKTWYEILYEDIAFDLKNQIQFIESGKKYVPCNKGGTFRKWYGNNEYLAFWWKSTEFHRNGSTYQDKLFIEGMTWSAITTYKFSARFYNEGFIFDHASPSLFAENKEKLFEYLGFFNSTVGDYLMNIVNPTINSGADSLRKMPYKTTIFFQNTIVKFVKNNIDISKQDWDSFETSWNFTEHPLVRYSRDLWDSTGVGATMHKYYGRHIEAGSPLELCYLLWQGECNERFNQLKANEEELNRIFIEIYGLQDELTPEVEDKDVTVRKADLTRDIKSFISYAVGCMFGRYSLNVDGLAYAGGEWDSSKYRSFMPDEDNIIPIYDEEYYSEDDIVGRFIKFVSIVFGEETLDENLSFIAKALGGSGAPKQVIRNYFLNNFFADHCQTYQVTGSGKRPIYWQFDSGKQNGFKALVYMHRYDEDLVSRVRTNYLHKIQSIYEYKIKDEEYIIDHSDSRVDVTRARKNKDKLEKQLAETKVYDQAMSHVANQRISIDLDDGVKVNYAKFQGVEVINEGSKTIKVDLLSKIK